MQVRVLAFGVLRDLLGWGGQTIVLPEGAAVGDLLEHLRGEGGHPVWGSLAAAVNREYAGRSAVLHEDDEVALLPPVSGGAEPVPPVVRLVREPIAREELIRRLARGVDGAVVVFEGIVRNQTRGRETLFLDYEAYEEMALSEMQRLAAEAQARFAIDGVGMVHRLGRLEVGEASVVIVVTSAHRAAAFEACRWLIDTLKQTVPVWKRETFADGAIWADGEPFPASLVPGA
jgi:molybdopterin synthase catalytic subunit